jgi:hypothetical protein
MTKKAVFSAIVKFLVLASCVLGLSLHRYSSSGGFMHSIYGAFTAQSNIWISLICIIFFIMNAAGIKKNRLLYLIKFMFTSSILLTWLVFAVLLAPILDSSYILSPSNIFLHSITPILAMADFLLFDNEFSISLKSLWTVLVMPLIYLVFAFTVYEQSGSLPTYYFFLDYKKLGWFTMTSTGIGTGFWILLLSAVLYLKGIILLILKNSVIQGNSAAKALPFIKKSTVTAVSALTVMVLCSSVSTIISLIINS